MILVIFVNLVGKQYYLKYILQQNVFPKSLMKQVSKHGSQNPNPCWGEKAHKRLANKKRNLEDKELEYSHITHILRCSIYIDNLVILIDVGAEEHGDTAAEYI